jgi:hypothetical protein
MAEICFKSFLRIRSQAKGPHVEYLSIIKSIWMRLDITDEAENKILRLSATRPDEYSVPPVDMTEYPLF